jgi:hypothetical protein
MIVAVPVERRRDGKLHPVGGYRSEAELHRVLTLVHEMRCRDGMSLRKIVAALADQHGLRVSRGSVHRYTRDFECDRCAGDA